MKTNQTFAKKSNARLVRLLLVAAGILLALAIVQLTIGTGIDGQGFNWKTNDFIIMGLLLFGTALLCEVVLRNINTRTMRILMVVLILVALLLIVVDLGVGIFNIPGFSGS